MWARVGPDNTLVSPAWAVSTSNRFSALVGSADEPLVDAPMSALPPPLAPPRRPAVTAASGNPPRPSVSSRESTGVIDSAGAVPLRLYWWNAQGLKKHVNEWRDYLFRHSASFCGVSETWLWGECMSDARFQWLRGPERPPHAATSRVRGGMGALVPRALEAAVVRTTRTRFGFALACARRGAPCSYALCTRRSAQSAPHVTSCGLN